MLKRASFLVLLVTVLLGPLSVVPALAQSVDIRGPWVGNAKGSIFGAEGSVEITHQQGENIRGIVEGGNFFGKAKFGIDGKVRGNQIFGSKDGHTFNGYLYADGTIRGLFRASDGDSYRVLLRRPYPQWGMQYQPMPYQNQPYQGQPQQGYPYQADPYQGGPYSEGPYQSMPYQGMPYQNRW